MQGESISTHSGSEWLGGRSDVFAEPFSKISVAARALHTMSMGLPRRFKYAMSPVGYQTGKLELRAMRSPCFEHRSLRPTHCLSDGISNRLPINGSGRGPGGRGCPCVRCFHITRSRICDITKYVKTRAAAIPRGCSNEWRASIVAAVSVVGKGLAGCAAVRPSYKASTHCCEASVGRQCSAQPARPRSVALTWCPT